MPKFQDPTHPPSFQTPSAKFLFKLQLTHENMGPRLSGKMKMVRNLGLAFKFKLSASTKSFKKFKTFNWPR